MNVPKKSIQLTTSSMNFILKHQETVDFRLDEDSWKDLQQGDILEFWEDFSGWDKEPSENSRILRVKIKEIFRAATFADIIDSLPPSITTQMNKKEVVTNLHSWWPEEAVKNTGALGIVVMVVDVKP